MKIKTKIIILFSLVIVFCLFIIVCKAEAGTFTAFTGIRYNVNLNKSTYTPGENMTLSASVTNYGTPCNPSICVTYWLNYGLRGSFSAAYAGSLFFPVNTTGVIRTYNAPAPSTAGNYTAVFSGTLNSPPEHSVSYTVRNFTCTSSIPSGSTMCPSDNIGLTSDLAWQYVGTSSSSCTTARKCQYYTVPISNNIPTANITAPSGNRTITAGQSISFSGTGSDSDGTINGYAWYQGSCVGTLLATNSSFNRTFNTPGTYRVYFRVRDNDGAWSTNCPSRLITVNAPVVPAPTCSVSYNRSSVTSGGSATLSWSSTNDADGNMEFSCTNFYQSSPGVMTYNGSGRSNATSASGSGTATWNTSVNSSERCTFTARNSAGVTATCSDTLTVDAPATPAPSLSLTANPTSIYLGNYTRLTWSVNGATSCSASSTSGGNWSGAKTSSNGTYSNNVYPTSTGTKTYTMSCSNSGGTTTRSVNVSVNAVPNVAPTASITAPSGNRTITTGQSISFSGTGSDSDGSITNYEWRQGGCTGTLLSTSSSFNRTFNSSGSYRIYLRVRDNDGAWSTNCPSRLITVETPPPPPPINGTCGSYNDKTYYFNDIGWGSGTFCLSGTASPSSPPFPAIGGTTSWICEGLNGGDSSGTCKATRDNLPFSLSFQADDDIISDTNPLSENITVDPNQSFYLVWEPQSAKSCTATVGSETDWLVPPSKTFADGTHKQPFSYPPAETGLKTYNLECFDSASTVSIKKTVTVDVQPFQCQGTNPATLGASPLDPEEETELPNGSISWTHDDNGIDDPLKCEFECDTGSSWDSATSACVLDPVDGACGGYNGKTYYPDDTDWGSGQFCYFGTANPSSPSFPAVGTTTEWTCDGLNGGDPSGTCSATRNTTQPPPPKATNWSEVNP